MKHLVLLKNSMEGIVNQIKDCWYFNASFYDQKGDWLKDQHCDNIEEFIELIEKYKSDRRFKMKLTIEDEKYAELKIRASYQCADCLQLLKDSGCFNIHEYVNANQLIGIQETMDDIRRFARMPVEPPQHIKKEINIDKVDLENLFKLNNFITINYKDNFGMFMDSDMHSFASDFLYSVQDYPVIKVEYEKYADDVTLTVWQRYPVVYAEDFREQTDKRFDEMLWCHGLSAFCGTKDPVENAKGVVNNSEWEICCSHEEEPIGPFGLYVKGTVEIVSNIDLMSKIDMNGKRGMNKSASDWRMTGVISTPEEIDRSKWDHMEAIIKDTKITGMWVKRWYVDRMNDSDKEELQKIMRVINVHEYKIVNDRIEE